MPFSRAPRITFSSSEKSKWSSIGSIISKETLPSNVLTLAAFMFGYTVDMNLAEDRELLCSSAESIIKDLPLRYNCEDVLVLRRCGCEGYEAGFSIVMDML